MATWIQELLMTTTASESPKKYWYWAGLSAISAVVKNNVFLDKHMYKLYPNTYVILVGKSGLRKGPPVAFAKALVKEVNTTRVITGRTSIQSAIFELKDAITKENGGPPIKDATGFLVSSEFAAFIVHDPFALTILTDLYDGHYNPDWDSGTMSLRKDMGGKVVLKNPCITLLSASNETHFRDMIPDDAIGGGFIARTCIINADKKAGVNSLTRKPDMVPTIAELSPRLKQIATVNGGFRWESEGADIYDEWYADFNRGEYDDKTGTTERLHDHVLKTAMLLSLSRSSELVLRGADVKEAILACQDFVPGARKLAMTSGGTSQAAPGTAEFIKALLAKEDHKMSRTRMNQRHWSYFDMFEQDRIAESLAAAKVITISEEKNSEKRLEQFYTLNQKVVDKYTKLEKEEE